MPTTIRASSGSPWWQGWSEDRGGKDSVARMKRSEIRGKLSPMVRYRRNFVPGGTFFFTVTLADRQASLLVDHVGLLRAAFRNTRERRSFAIDAIVILPDHLHAILTLPPGDSDFSGRWKAIKAAFTRSTLQQGQPFPAIAVASIYCGRGASGNTRYATIRILIDARIMFTSTRSNIDWYRSQASGRFHHCIDMSAPGYCQAIGVETTVQTIAILASALSNPRITLRSIRATKLQKTPASLPGFCIC
jgi:REP element-mobilizing transposase RayT